MFMTMGRPLLEIQCWYKLELKKINKCIKKYKACVSEMIERVGQPYAKIFNFMKKKIILQQSNFSK